MDPLFNNDDIKTFDDVLRVLGKIIEWSISTRSRVGFFAAIYKNVTQRIKAAAENGEFLDRARIELLDVSFARRYFSALDDYQQQLNTTTAWAYALKRTKLRFTIILQQLLLCMNPHINIDLAMATEGITSRDNLLYIYPDFLKVNQILASALLQIEREIFELSPVLSLASKFGMKTENQFFNFSLSVARSESWCLACQLKIADEGQKKNLTDKANQASISLGKKILSPGLLGTIAFFIIGIFEFKSIRTIIRVLDSKIGLT